jgi:hypothetical protein
MNFVQQPVRIALTSIALAIASLALTACGGGGSSDNNPPAVVIDRTAIEKTAADAAAAAAAADTKVKNLSGQITAAAAAATTAIAGSDKLSAEASLAQGTQAETEAKAQVEEAKAKSDAAQTAADSLNPRSTNADASAATAKAEWQAAQATLNVASASLAKAKKLAGNFSALDGAMNSATLSITAIEKAMVVNARASIADVPADSVALASNLKGKNVSDKSIQDILNWWANGNQDALLEGLRVAITAIGNGHDARTAAISDTLAKAAGQPALGKEVKDLLVKLDELRRLRALLVANGITVPAELDVVLNGYGACAAAKTPQAVWALGVLAAM